jgi:hypothetical protein
MMRLRFLVAYFGIVVTVAVTLMVAFPVRSRPPQGEDSSIHEADLTRGLLSSTLRSTRPSPYVFVCDACDLISDAKGTCPVCRNRFERVRRGQVSFDCTACAVKSQEPGTCGSCGRDLSMVLRRPQGTS